jgi:vancomycin permeability regulator SanA
VVLVFGLTVSAILYVGFFDNIQKSDMAIILGSKVKRNGLPSRRLAARLNKGIELYQKGFFNRIIVSGGTGKEGFDEALVMKKYLVAHKIPAAIIITDSHGNNTQDTAINSRIIMQKLNLKSALVISQYFHILRATLALKQSGISPVYHAHASYFARRDFYSIFREVVAIYDYLLFRKYDEIDNDSSSTD